MSSRPIKSDGSIDWEQVFEHPNIGFVPLIQQATTIRGLELCSREIVDKLFVRDTDSEKRAAFQHILDHLFADSTDVHSDLQDLRTRVLMVMRQVKIERKKRAGMSQEKKRLAQERRKAGLEHGSDDVEVSTPRGIDPSDAEGLLVHVFVETYRSRFDALVKNIDGRKAPGGALPYFLSKTFADRFIKILKDDFGPSFARPFRGLLLPLENAEIEEREQILDDVMREPMERVTAWEAWRILWNEKTVEEDLPSEPEPPKKKSFFQKMIADEEPDWAKPMTHEEWQEEAQKIKQQNTEVRNLWNKIATPGEGFIEPSMADHEVLLDLFAQSMPSIETHVKVLNKIATEKSEMGRTFDTYAKGKALDLPILIAVYRDPKLFLGKKTVLKTMLASSRGSRRERIYPLTDRFLGPFIP